MASDEVGVGFRGPQVCKIAGITYRQLDYWTRSGLVRSSVAGANGSGTQRQYGYRDLLEIKVIKSLLDAGVSLKQARTAIEYLRENLGEDLSSASLLLNGSRSILARDGDELIDILRNGQTAFSVVALAGVEEQVNAGIRELPLAPGDTESGEPPVSLAN